MMEAYLYTFVNQEQNNWARLLLVAEFAYNNFKNASIGHIPFELNCQYHLWVFFKDECNAQFKSFFANELAIKLKELINIYCQNLLYAQDLEKQAYDKGIKPQSYA